MPLAQIFAIARGRLAAVFQRLMYH